MMKRLEFLIVVAFVIALCSTVHADLPFPLHTVEGNSGVFLTSTAYFANPPEEGKMLGGLNFSASDILIDSKNLGSLAITENIIGRFELGYAYELFSLGDLPGDVRKGMDARMDSTVGVHNFNMRAMIVQEGAFEHPWMPAITLGAHMKWNDGTRHIDRDTGYWLLEANGNARNSGTDFTLVSSKTIEGLLPRPVVFSAGIRNSSALHTGFLGFAGENQRKFTFEGSIFAYVTEKLAFAAEYRQKANLMTEETRKGYELLKPEGDWWSLCLVYMINDRFSLTAAFADLDNIANRSEDAAWGMQLKYEH